ncbi:MAG: hypothetical protein M3Q88_06930, partial [Pseudomonadota bacterium]|nr:hypothetical protein [Pseudomonadota bacterium]
MLSQFGVKRMQGLEDEGGLAALSGSIAVTFIGFEFVTSGGKQKRLTHTTVVDEIGTEDVAKAIRHIRDEGGIWVTDEDGVWFMPWP